MTVSKLSWFKFMLTSVTFIQFFVFGFWSLFVYILQGKMGKPEKEWKENHATKVTKIPKTKRQKFGMNETLLNFCEDFERPPWPSLYVFWHDKSNCEYYIPKWGMKCAINLHFKFYSFLLELQFLSCHFKKKFKSLINFTGIHPFYNSMI